MSICNRTGLVDSVENCLHDTCSEEKSCPKWGFEPTSPMSQFSSEVTGPQHSPWSVCVCLCMYVEAQCGYVLHFQQKSLKSIFAELRKSHPKSNMESNIQFLFLSQNMKIQPLLDTMNSLLWKNSSSFYAITLFIMDHHAECFRPLAIFKPVFS